MNSGLFSTGTVDWETPWHLFNRLNQIYNFNLDACATATNAKVSCYYTPEMDALTLPWIGSIWMNPPYGREIYKWVRKAYTESCRPDTIVVCLLPSRTDTYWWHDYVMKAKKIYLVKGRLKFGNSENSAPFPSCIAVFSGEGHKPVIESWI